MYCVFVTKGRPFHLKRTATSSYL